MSSQNAPPKTNIDNFLSNVTPVLSFENLIKEEIMNECWQPSENEEVEGFMLNDLWNYFEKASTYGVAVPITLENCQHFTQHFAPTLSAIQIFTRNSSPHSIRLDCPYLHFIEYIPPCSRHPFKDQIDMLAQSYNGLKSFTSVDLSPASWMSIAWYPIYSIPKGQNQKDLSTCFLTYHTLSYSFQGVDLVTSGMEGAEIECNTKAERKEGEDLPLPPFGLVAHKMYGDIWLADMKAEDNEGLGMMHSMADSWLHQLNVDHHDYNIFSRN